MIKNITDKFSFARAGKIHLGIMSNQTKAKSQYPTKTDFFVVKQDNSTSIQSATSFKTVYGDKPRELRVIFPNNDIGIIFPQFYKRYAGAFGRVCRGEGRNSQDGMRWNEETLNNETVDCSGDDCEWYKRGACKRAANLQFFLPDVPIAGFWQLDTSARYSMENINMYLRTMKMYSGGKIDQATGDVTGGWIAYIPFKLKVRPKQVRPSGKKMQLVYVLELEFDGTTEQYCKICKEKEGEKLISLPMPESIEEDLYPHDIVKAVQKVEEGKIENKLNEKKEEKKEVVVENKVVAQGQEQLTLNVGKVDGKESGNPG